MKYGARKTVRGVSSMLTELNAAVKRYSDKVAYGNTFSMYLSVLLSFGWLLIGFNYPKLISFIKAGSLLNMTSQ